MLKMTFTAVSLSTDLPFQKSLLLQWAKQGQFLRPLPRLDRFQRGRSAAAGMGPAAYLSSSHLVRFAVYMARPSAWRARKSMLTSSPFLNHTLSPPTMSRLVDDRKWW